MNMEPGVSISSNEVAQIIRGVCENDPDLGIIRAARVVTYLWERGLLVSPDAAE